MFKNKRKTPKGYRSIVVGEKVYWWKVSIHISDCETERTMLTIYDSETKKKVNVQPSKVFHTEGGTVSQNNVAITPKLVRQLILDKFENVR